MSCQTVIREDNVSKDICGHSLMRHDGDESGMGAPQPCMVGGCPCEGYTRIADPGGNGRIALLRHIEKDQRLHGLAATAEGWVQRNKPELEPGGSDFYSAVLERVKVLQRHPSFGQPGDPAGTAWKKPPPPVPSFEAPPSFYCGMNEED